MLETENRAVEAVERGEGPQGQQEKEQGKNPQTPGHSPAAHAGQSGAEQHRDADVVATGPVRLQRAAAAGPQFRQVLFGTQTMAKNLRPK